MGVYVAFGLLGPLNARYIKEILSRVGMSDGTVIVAAGALAFDAIPEMGVFLRTRVNPTEDPGAKARRVIRGRRRGLSPRRGRRLVRDLGAPVTP